MVNLVLRVNFWVLGSCFVSGLFESKAPVYLDLLPVLLRCPGICSLPEFFQVTDAPVQAVPEQGEKPSFGHAEPWACLGVNTKSSCPLNLLALASNRYS